MKNTRKKHFSRFAATALIAVLLFTHAGMSQATPRVKGDAAILKGFAPETKISYTIEGAAGSLTQGEGVADKNGRFVIPAPAKIPYESLPVSYRLEVEEPGAADPLNFTATMHPGEGGISLKVTGLNEFSQIETKADSGAANGRSDWAGMFSMDKAGTLEDVVGAKSFEVAFLGGRMNDSTERASPHIIQVQMPTLGCPPTAPGGVTLSICQPGQIERLGENLKENLIGPAQNMTRQLSLMMPQQMSIFGKMLDAKMQLETQRLQRQMIARTHKDYQPSEQMCEFGSFMRSLPKVEEKTQVQKAALNRGLMVDYTNRLDASTSIGRQDDINTRNEQFLKYYCNPDDNAGKLGGVCKHAEGGAAAKPERRDRDIDYARLVGLPLTINADFTTANTGTEQETEEDMLALGRNLYFPDAFNPSSNPEGESDNILNSRRLVSMINVAHNTYANIIAMKTKETPQAGKPGGSDYMKAMLKEFGLTDDEIKQMIGENPSYYAQMEVLTKKIYQSPDFYTNLYDKPANVDRIGVSIDAIGLMQTRDLYKVALRREMLTSMMVEAALTSHVSSTDSTTRGAASPAEAAD